MVIGISIALIGVAVLATSLLFTSTTYTDYSSLIIHMLPRLSVVVLIELFAYFFLRMYRSNLAEIRYFQNEISNMELKKVSTFLAINSNSIEGILKDFSQTDRNAVMKSDQTTQELERLKIESQANKNALNTLSSIFSKTSK